MQTAAPIKEELIQSQILQAAKHLFRVYGLHKVTMDDVAKAVGKGRSSLYYYYKSKEEIFDAVMGVEIDEMMGAIGRAVETARGVEGKIFAFCLAKIKVAREKKAFFAMLGAGMDADAMSAFKQQGLLHRNLLMQKENALLRDVLTAGIKAAEIRAMGDKGLDTATFVLLASIHGVKQECLLNNDGEGTEEAVQALARMVVFGLK